MKIMIKIEHFDVFNLEGAIRGMRNPMESWDKSDTVTCMDIECSECRFNSIDCRAITDVIIGEKDLELMRRLYKAGSDHSKFMRQIFVSMDITAPLYWWKEFDTYKVGTVANSCSTMHTLHKRRLTIDDFSHEHLSTRSYEALEGLIGVINESRRRIVEDVDEKDKKYHWWQMIQLLPSSYNQKRTVTMSYANLAAIITARGCHKLNEWVIFCAEILTNAPYLAEIIKGEEDD